VPSNTAKLTPSLSNTTFYREEKDEYTEEKMSQQIAANPAAVDSPDNSDTPNSPDNSKITTCLWFDKVGLEAAELYVSLLPDSEITSVEYFASETPGGKPGDVLMVHFKLCRVPFTSLNGGPNYQLSPAASIVVSCEDQAELDRLWDALSAGGEEMNCGWVQDRFGMSWQIIPKALGEILSGNDPAKSERAMQAMLQMKKIDIAALQNV